VVKVRFEDLDPESGEYSPGRRVTILEWRACRGGGCGSSATVSDPGDQP
jgi:hypothetical protein